MNTQLIPLISCIISIIFSIMVFAQYATRQKPYQLIWAIGLLMYSISTLAEFWAGTLGINDTVYRLWYLNGAIFVAAYLGMGTVYLLARRLISHVILGILVILSLFAIYRVFTVSVDISTLTSLNGSAMPTSIRLMTPLFNTFGTVTLVGGALYSAWFFWRRRSMPRRLVSNILIAVGAILPALGGTTAKLGGSTQYLYLLELIGIIVIFTGFLVNHEVLSYRLSLKPGINRITV